MGVGRCPGIPEAQPVTVGGREVQGVRELVGGRGNQSVTPGRDVPRAGYYKEKKKLMHNSFEFVAFFLTKLFQEREQNNIKYTMKVCMQKLYSPLHI